MANRKDLYEGHDYYNLDEFLSEEHLLARESIRGWVKQEVTPFIEGYTERAECPKHLFKGLARCV